MHQIERLLGAWRLRAALFLALGLGTLLFTACGFHLRGVAQLPFNTLYLQAGYTSPLGHEIRRNLRTSNVRLVDSPAGADATLIIMSELREKQILSLSGTGTVREYQLRYRVGYQVTDGKATTLIAPTEIVLKRDVSFQDSQVLAKEAEEANLYRDMQSDAVNQLVRRLQAAKLPTAAT